MAAAADISTTSVNDMAEPPASKRRRISTTRYASQVTQDTFGPRSETLWFRDGTVIVVAVGMSFRVYAGILERHSTVFKDLLDVKPRQKVERSEGCRVLRVEDDGNVLGELLLILHDGGNSGFFDRRKPIHFAKLHTLTLLACKYRIHSIINEAIERLEVVFPVVFDDKRVHYNSYYRHIQDTPIDGLEDDSCLAAVHLARAIDPEHPPAFITMALYFCCTLRIDVLFDACEVGRGEDRTKLSQRDLRMCMLASQKLQELLVTVRSSVIDVSDVSPCGAKSCRAARQSLFVDWAADNDLARTTPLNTMPWKSSAWKPLCCDCLAALRAMYNKRREVAFTKLGEIFGIRDAPAEET